MEGKSMLKLSHVVAFLLLASRKSSWPELVGEPLSKAKEIIEKENPAAHVVVRYPFITPVPGIFVCGEVSVSVNWDLTVASVPRMNVCCWEEAQRMA